jgi:hypothetical protein
LLELNSSFSDVITNKGLSRILVVDKKQDPKSLDLVVYFNDYCNNDGIEFIFPDLKSKDEAYSQLTQRTFSFIFNDLNQTAIPRPIIYSIITLNKDADKQIAIRIQNLFLLIWYKSEQERDKDYDLLLEELKQYEKHN